MLRPDEKKRLAKLFNERLPATDGEADAFLEAESFSMFAARSDSGLLTRFALTSDEVLDLAINPICAARLAATLLDVLSKSGEYIVDLAIYDSITGDQLTRLRP